jgi:hypothetical protein
MMQDLYESFVLWMPQSIAGPVVEVLYLLVDLGHQVITWLEQFAELFGCYVYN